MIPGPPPEGVSPRLDLKIIPSKLQISFVQPELGLIVSINAFVSLIVEKNRLRVERKDIPQPGPRLKLHHRIASIEVVDSLIVVYRKRTVQEVVVDREFVHRFQVGRRSCSLHLGLGDLFFVFFGYAVQELANC